MFFSLLQDSSLALLLLIKLRSLINYNIIQLFKKINSCLEAIIAFQEKGDSRLRFLKNELIPHLNLFTR